MECYGETEKCKYLYDSFWVEIYSLNENLFSYEIKLKVEGKKCGKKKLRGEEDN